MITRRWRLSLLMQERYLFTYVIAFVIGWYDVCLMNTSKAMTHLTVIKVGAINVQEDKWHYVQIGKDCCL